MLKKKRTLQFSLLPTIVYLCLLPLLLSLGGWQLNRAEQKRELIAQQQRNESADVFQLSATTAIDLETLRYRKVKVSGHYDNSQQFLLDNQISNGKVGYFVLTPFLLADSNKAVLINRGWLPLLATRSQLPDVSFTSSQTTLEGRINFFPSVGIKLQDGDKPTATTPSLIQFVNTEVLAEKLNYPLLPLQIELATHMPNGFKRDWQTTTLMPPERHIGYAIQWFALAATLTFLFFWYSFKKSHD